MADSIESWKKGIENFNSRRFWEAHESWELGWKGLPEPARTYMQALIQATSSFHLIEQGRLDPALRLCRSARAKLASVGWPAGLDFFPRVEIPGLAAELAALELRIESGGPAAPAPPSLRASWIVAPSRK